MIEYDSLDSGPLGEETTTKQQNKKKVKGKQDYEYNFDLFLNQCEITETDKFEFYVVTT